MIIEEMEPERIKYGNPVIYIGKEENSIYKDLKEQIKQELKEELLDEILEHIRIHYYE